MINDILFACGDRVWTVFFATQYETTFKAKLVQLEIIEVYEPDARSNYQITLLAQPVDDPDAPAEEYSSCDVDRNPLKAIEKRVPPYFKTSEEPEQQAVLADLIKQAHDLPKYQIDEIVYYVDNDRGHYQLETGLIAGIYDDHSYELRDENNRPAHLAEAKISRNPLDAVLSVLGTLTQPSQGGLARHPNAAIRNLRDLLEQAHQAYHRRLIRIGENIGRSAAYRITALKRRINLLREYESLYGVQERIDFSINKLQEEINQIVVAQPIETLGPLIEWMKLTTDENEPKG